MTKGVFDSISKGLSLTGSSVKSLGKVLIQSRPTTRVSAPKGDTLIILGNGPSLRDTLANSRATLDKAPKLAVNFAANSPEYRQLRPDYYVLADPHFFNPSSDSNVERLIQNLNATDWDLTLFVPREADTSAITAGNITIQRFNPVGVEGWRWLRHALYRRRLGMPRPRNVLIPSIMIGLWLGYKEIYLTGADHSWTRTLSVNDDNEVVSVQPHFYKDDAKELSRVSHEYRNYHLHDILMSFYVAFRSYFDIADYARSTGAHIYNATPGSFIDAFPRRSLPADNA